MADLIETLRQHGGLHFPGVERSRAANDFDIDGVGTGGIDASAGADAVVDVDFDQGPVEE